MKSEQLARHGWASCSFILQKPTKKDKNPQNLTLSNEITPQEPTKRDKKGEKRTKTNKNQQKPTFSNEKPPPKTDKNRQKKSIDKIEYMS